MIGFLIFSFAYTLSYAGFKHPGARFLTTTGSVLCVPLLLALSLITRSSSGQKIFLCGLLTLVGLALTLIVLQLMAEMNSIVTAKEANYPAIFWPEDATAQVPGYESFSTYFTLVPTKILGYQRFPYTT